MFLHRYGETSIAGATRWFVVLIGLWESVIFVNDGVGSVIWCDNGRTQHTLFLGSTLSLYYIWCILSNAILEWHLKVCCDVEQSILWVLMGVVIFNIRSLFTEMYGSNAHGDRAYSLREFLSVQRVYQVYSWCLGIGRSGASISSSFRVSYIGLLQLVWLDFPYIAIKFMVIIVLFADISIIRLFVLGA